LLGKLASDHSPSDASDENRSVRIHGRLPAIDVEIAGGAGGEGERAAADRFFDEHRKQFALGIRQIHGSRMRNWGPRCNALWNAHGSRCWFKRAREALRMLSF
jgi:hypothetical protein